MIKQEKPLQFSEPRIKGQQSAAALLSEAIICNPEHEQTADRAEPTSKPTGSGKSIESPLLDLFKLHAFHQSYQPDSTILLHGTSADAVYLVVSGTVRCCTITEDGRRQVFRFAKKGELIGLADIDTWHFTGEAVDHVILKSIPRWTIEQTLANSPPLRQEFRARICELLEDREKQLLSLATCKASKRLFDFLSEFAATRSTDGYVALPMCRRDIADHLNMSVETVSRAFSDLKASGHIDLACAEKFKINRHA